MTDLCPIHLVVGVLDDDAVFCVCPFQSGVHRLQMRLLILLLKLRYPALLSDELLVVPLLASVFTAV